MNATLLFLCVTLAGGPASQAPGRDTPVAAESTEPTNEVVLETWLPRAGAFAAGTSAVGGAIFAVTAAGSLALLGGTLAMLAFRIGGTEYVGDSFNAWSFLVFAPGTILLAPAASLFFISVPVAAGALLVGLLVAGPRERKGIARRAAVALASAGGSLLALLLLAATPPAVLLGGFAAQRSTAAGKTTLPRTERAVDRVEALVALMVFPLVALAVAGGAAALLLQVGLAWLQLDALNEPDATGATP